MTNFSPSCPHDCIQRDYLKELGSMTYRQLQPTPLQGQIWMSARIFWWKLKLYHVQTPRQISTAYHPIFILGTHVGIVLNYMRDNINIEHKPEIYDTKQLTICWNIRIITASVLQVNLNTINGTLWAFSKECNKNLFQSLSVQIFQRCTYSEIRSTHSQNVKRLSKFGPKLKNFAFFCVVIVVVLFLKVMPVVSKELDHSTSGCIGFPKWHMLFPRCSCERFCHWMQNHAFL